MTSTINKPKLVFGTGGSPLTSKGRDAVSGIKRIHELGLGHMELEFVYGVKMTEEVAEKVRDAMQKYKVSLSVHGPYYMNLGSLDNKTFHASISYIAQSIYIGGLAGASSVTFHPGFFIKGDVSGTFEQVQKGLKKVYLEFAKPKFVDHPVNKHQIFVAPELTGKPSQFGDIEDLVKLAKIFRDQDLRFCFDFAHKFARTQGKFNTREDFAEVLDFIAKELGRDFLSHMHIHLSGIMYSEKGERNHVSFLPTYEEYEAAGVRVEGGKKIIEGLSKKNKAGGSSFNWRELLEVLKEKNVGGFVVCESPALELDALLMQKYYQNL